MDGGRGCCGGYGPCPHHVHDAYQYGASASMQFTPNPAFAPVSASTPFSIQPTVYQPPCATLYRVVAQPAVPLVDSLPSSVNNMHVSPRTSQDVPETTADSRHRQKRVRDVSNDEEEGVVDTHCSHNSTQPQSNKLRPKMARVNAAEGREQQEVVSVDDQSPDSESFDAVEPELASLAADGEASVTGDQSAIVIDLTNLSDEDTTGGLAEAEMDVVESRPCTPQPARSTSRQSRSSSTLDSQAHRRSESASSTQQHREPIASPLLDASGRPSLHRCDRYGAACARAPPPAPASPRRNSRSACRHACQCPRANAHVSWCASCPCHSACAGHCSYPPMSNLPHTSRLPNHAQPAPLPQQTAHPLPPPPPYFAFDSAGAAASAPLQGYIGNYHTVYGAYPFFTAAAPMPAPQGTMYVSANQAAPASQPPVCTTAPNAHTNPPPHMQTPFHRRNHAAGGEVTGLSWPEPPPARHSTPRPDPVHNMNPQHRRLYHNQHMQQQNQREFFEHYQQQRRRHAAGPVVFHPSVPVSDPALVHPAYSIPPASALSLQFAAAAASHTMHAALNAMQMEGIFGGVHAITPSFPQPVPVSHPLEAMAAASHGNGLLPMEQRAYVLVAPPGGPFAQQVFPTASVMTAQNPIELNLLYHPIAVNGFEGEMPPIGVSIEVIERVTRLQQYTRPADVADGEEERCTVCLSEFESREHVRLLQCAHFFHKMCIDRWLTQNKTCPVCRVDCDRDKQRANANEPMPPNLIHS